MAAVGLQKTLGFEILPEVKPGEVEARFTVTEAVAQPYGYCSGGTMLALEETMAGAGSRRIAGEDAMPLGINVSANHVKAVPVGGACDRPGDSAPHGVPAACLERGSLR